MASLTEIFAGSFRPTRIAYRSRQRDSTISNIHRGAFHRDASPSQERIYAVSQAAVIFTSALRWQDKNSLLRNAIYILSKVSPRPPAAKRRIICYPILPNFPHLLFYSPLSREEGADITAFHYLRLLDLGRGFVMGLVIDCQDDLSELQTERPDVQPPACRDRSPVDQTTRARRGSEARE